MKFLWIISCCLWIFPLFTWANSSDEIALLSPACASWDQYDSFEVRGKDFKKIVEELKNE